MATRCRYVGHALCCLGIVLQRGCQRRRDLGTANTCHACTAAGRGRGARAAGLPPAARGQYVAK
eukprot:5619452-Lingulodinium_polyedra.AAC.1